MFKDLNRAGLTSFGVAGCDADLIALYRRWASEDKLNVRTYCINGVGVGTSPEQVERALPRIAEMKLFQGDNYVDDIFYGESVYGPLHDPMFIAKSDPKPEQLAHVAEDRDGDRQGAPAVARARQPHRHDHRIPRSDRGHQQASTR